MTIQQKLNKIKEIIGNVKKYTFQYHLTQEQIELGAGYLLNEEKFLKQNYFIDMGYQLEKEGMIITDFPKTEFLTKRKRLYVISEKDLKSILAIASK